MSQSEPPPLSRAGRIWNSAKRMVVGSEPRDIERDLQQMREQAQTPVFWLFGKTQSGKTSIVRFLTGATDAEIGSGFRPCTQTSRKFPFPTEEAPALTFLDTRGVDEPSYNPAEDLAAFNKDAHVLIITCRLTDFAHGKLRESLAAIRKANPRRPVLLALTCLHEAYPQTQHPAGPLVPGLADTVYADALKLLAEQQQKFEGLFDRMVAIDLTKPEEGYTNSEYGGEALKQTLLELLPLAYRQTLLQLDAATGGLRSIHLQRAVPTLIGYSSLAAAAGAVPIPFVDLLILPGIQSKMIRELAQLSGQTESGKRFLEISASMGMGLLMQQAVREVAKFIPYVGSAVGGAIAYGSTYALGRAFLSYLQQLHDGHAPDTATVKALYQTHLMEAEKRWKATH